MELIIVCIAIFSYLEFIYSCIRINNKFSPIYVPIVYYTQAQISNIFRQSESLQAYLSDRMCQQILVQ